ncbi:MAG: hypothetical protein M3Y72_17895 [Acidobacteriota bacterium]|nr:hypothetical protein [Acidobacteriota bacterium]
MGKPIDWLPLVPAALATLRDSTAPLVDRATLEKLLQIHRRTAIRLLHQFGARAVGTTLVLERQTLIGQLQTCLPENREPAAPSQIRRSHQAAEAFRFPDVRVAERRTLDTLPAAIRLAPGQLSIEVADLRDLCAQLWVLLETCQDDWNRVEQRLAGPC